jgi:hypothetical protein
MRLFQHQQQKDSLLSAALVWIAVTTAMSVHMYWAAVRLPAIFLGREIYLASIGVGYVADWFWWQLLHILFTCLGVHGHPPTTYNKNALLVCDAGLPPLADYLLSYDLTFEVFLAGVFIGVVVFHARCYGNGFKRLGSTTFVYCMGGMFPFTVSIIGWYLDVQSLSGYMLHWLTGFVVGLVRGMMVHIILCKRLPFWWGVCSRQSWICFQDTIIVNYPWMRLTFDSDLVDAIVQRTHQRSLLRIGKT